MKKVSLVSAVILGSIFMTAQAVHAAEPTVPNQKNTIGDVKFTNSNTETDNDGGDPVKPGEDGGDIGPGTDGEHTNGPLRLEWVPNIHFGNQKISSTNQSYPAIWNKAKMNKLPETTEVDYAPFVQVTDETGNPNQTWSLKVSMSEEGKFKSGPENILKNTYIVIHAMQRTNTVYKAEGENGGQLAETIVGDAIENTEKPINQAGVELAKTKKAGSTNGTRTSVIFAKDSDFDRGSGEMKTPHAPVNAALQLKTPSSDIKVKDQTYTATLTWELNDVN